MIIMIIISNNNNNINNNNNDNNSNNNNKITKQTTKQIEFENPQKPCQLSKIERFAKIVNSF